MLHIPAYHQPNSLSHVMTSIEKMCDHYCLRMIQEKCFRASTERLKEETGLTVSATLLLCTPDIHLCFSSRQIYNFGRDIIEEDSHTPQTGYNRRIEVRVTHR